MCLKRYFTPNRFHDRIVIYFTIGFKPGQRKVIFTCFKRNLVKELKVAQLAGSVAELSAYHHGEVGILDMEVTSHINYQVSTHWRLIVLVLSIVVIISIIIQHFGHVNSSVANIHPIFTFFFEHPLMDYPALA